MWLALCVACVLALFRVAEYIAVWQSDNGQAAFRQIRTDLFGLFWLLVFLIAISAAMMAAGRLASKSWHLLYHLMKPERVRHTGRLSPK
jgi:hypothetical protein